MTKRKKEEVPQDNSITIYANKLTVVLPGEDGIADIQDYKGNPIHDPNQRLFIQEQLASDIIEIMRASIRKESERNTQRASGVVRSSGNQKVDYTIM